MFRQQEVLTKLQLKTRALYFESQLDFILSELLPKNASHCAAEHADSDVEKDQSLTCADVTDLTQTPSLSSQSLSQLLYIAGEYQRLCLICAMHQRQCFSPAELKEDTQGVAAEDNFDFGSVREKMLEIPLATRGLIGLYGEQYLTPEAIQENFARLTVMGCNSKEL